MCPRGIVCVWWGWGVFGDWDQLQGLFPAPPAFLGNFFKADVITDSSLKSLVLLQSCFPPKPGLYVAEEALWVISSMYLTSPPSSAYWAQILRHRCNYLFLATANSMISSYSDLLATPAIFPAGLKALYGWGLSHPHYISLPNIGLCSYCITYDIG